MGNWSLGFRLFCIKSGLRTMTKELGHDDKHLQNLIGQLDMNNQLTGKIELLFPNNVMVRIARDRPGR